MGTETDPPPSNSIEGVAAQLSLSPDQVRDLIAAGALKTTGSGDALLVTPESLVLYMLSRITSQMDKTLARPSGGAVARSALLPLVVHLWFLAACVEVFSLRGKHPIAPLPAVALVLGAVLALAWWMARKSHDFSSTNGMGTTFHGRRMTPLGRVGTQWLTLVGIPLLPVRSYVILEAGDEKANWSGAIRTVQYRLRSLDGVHWPQALPILVGVWVGLAALVTAAVHL